MSSVMDKSPATRKGGSGDPPPPPPTETVNVDVVPKIKQANNVYCEISKGQNTSPTNVKGGVIKLPKKGTAYTVNFNLVADTAVPNLGWGTTNAGQCNGFWSKGAACPPGAEQDPQVTGAPTIAGNVLTVVITPTGSRNVVHYQLNFDQQGTPLQFDPIIINN